VEKLLLKYIKLITMSRIGKNPIKITTGVTVEIVGRLVTVTGPQGTLTLTFPPRLTVEVADGLVYVKRLSEDKKVKACHGAIRAEISNMISGVVTPWKKELEIRGTGYKFQLQGQKLSVSAGYINPVIIDIPQDLFFVTPDESKLVITGADKVKVGQMASNIRKIRTPEPYKGKGIRYLDEFIKLKAGKTAKA